MGENNEVFSHFFLDRKEHCIALNCVEDNSADDRTENEG